jgi:excisionase family DNA binding protein
MPGNIEVPVQSGKARDGLLSVKEAAAYLKMSPNWLYSSGIPFARLGRRRLYRRRDLDSFVEEHITKTLSRSPK